MSAERMLDEFIKWIDKNPTQLERARQVIVKTFLENNPQYDVSLPFQMKEQIEKLQHDIVDLYEDRHKRDETIIELKKKLEVDKYDEGYVYCPNCGRVKEF